MIRHGADIVGTEPRRKIFARITEGGVNYAGDGGRTNVRC